MGKGNGEESEEEKQLRKDVEKTVTEGDVDWEEDDD